LVLLETHGLMFLARLRLGVGEGGCVVALGPDSRAVTDRADSSTAVRPSIPARQKAVYCAIAKPEDEDDATNLPL
jgi:hypothetical protein